MFTYGPQKVQMNHDLGAILFPGHCHITAQGTLYDEARSITCSVLSHTVAQNVLMGAGWMKRPKRSQVHHQINVSSFNNYLG